jgi:CHAD domain-containing protein
MKIPSSASEAEPSAADGGADVMPAAAAALSAPESTFDASTSACEVAMAELRRLLAVWRIHEPGARIGRDPEELHQLRVTARRIDATLGLFKSQLPAALLRARRSTKAVLRSLGAARDLDVQLSELARYCAGLPESERAAAEPLRARLESDRSRARARLVRALDSEPTRRWLETLTLACAAGAERNGGERAMVLMPQRVRRRFRKLRKSVGKLRPKSPLEAYHQVRRRAKQLRYATECGALMFGRAAQDLLKALRRLQDRLGVHQDAYMAQSHLAALAADPGSGLPPATLFLMGRLAEHHARLTAQAHRTLTRSWRRVRGKRWKALRARLAELADRAEAANGAFDVQGTAAEDIAPQEAAPVVHAPAPEARPLKH